LGWGGYVHERTTRNGSSASAEGVTDFSLGAKIALSEQSGVVPQLSLIGEVAIPTGAEFSSDEPVPELKGIWAYEVTDQFGVAGNVNVAFPEEDAERYVEPAASLAAGLALTDSVGGYVEYFGFYPSGDAPDSTATHYLNGGFTWSVLADLQLDTLVGFGLNDAAEDLFCGFGFAYRR
ncbi:MAG: transporter, partial [Bdellovibrionales bacterium]|nr:transporter [Bdellovibrionales bacterium]